MTGPALLSMVLGVAMFGCESDTESETMNAMSTTDNDAGGETYAGPGWDESTTSDSQAESDTISDPPPGDDPTDDAGGETYAGPGWETTDGWDDGDTTTTTADATTTGGEDMGTSGSSDSTDAGDDVDPDPTDDAGGETYAGPGWEESTG